MDIGNVLEERDRTNGNRPPLLSEDIKSPSYLRSDLDGRDKKGGNFVERYDLVQHDDSAERTALYHFLPLPQLGTIQNGRSREPFTDESLTYRVDRWQMHRSLYTWSSKILKSF